MTKFVIISDSQISINNLQFSKITIFRFLCALYKQFPFKPINPIEFTYDQIQNELKLSHKTKRSLLLLFLKYNFISKINKKQKKPYFYAFNKKLNAILYDLQNL